MRHNEEYQMKFVGPAFKKIVYNPLFLKITKKTFKKEKLFLTGNITETNLRVTKSAFNRNYI